MADRENWAMKKHITVAWVLVCLSLLSACTHLALKESSEMAPLIIGGNQGSEAGQFNEPFAITVDASGNVFVADARNHRIQKFDENGKFISQWGGQGNDSGKFERPSGLAVDAEGNIFVADYELDRIQKFTADGKFLMQWGSSGSDFGQFNSPTGLAIDKHQKIYVTDTYNHRIQKFDMQGNYIKSWGQYQPVSLVRSFFSFLISPGADDKLNYPTRITIGPDEKLFVSDAYNNRIVVYSTDGEFLFQFGGVGIFSGNFRVSSGIANDQNGNLFVADFYNHRVQIFSDKGVFLSAWGKKGKRNGQFDGPTDIAVDQKGKVYVVDWGNHRIQVFQIQME